jgi:hypothetical protein
VAALDRAWQQIRDRHAEVPPVVLILGPSPSRASARRRQLGHYRTAGWSLREPATDLGRLRAAQEATDRAVERGDLCASMTARSELIGLQLGAVYRERDTALGEVLIATEGLANGARWVFAVLLHEASHAVAEQRGIKETSRQGRYHNHRFKLIAEELGLEGDWDHEIGWSLTTLSEEATAEYATALGGLKAALAGRAGPDDRAAAAADRGPVCGCGNWRPARPRRRGKAIVAGTIMCEACFGNDRATGQTG